MTQGNTPDSPEKRKDTFLDYSSLLSLSLASDRRSELKNLDTCSAYRQQLSLNVPHAASYRIAFITAVQHQEGSWIFVLLCV
ncbi:hypothetical protein Bhyg_05738 [Pseudolycoriella hygida]|uniref:Uncharacterized protein n=1 Tax=Pseudolycoriella hygida TaxID=35572 RepID=A0A9Q0N0T7_9DIPT|nr:hypothetical protein Bhyg_05738 [Pseudolycoriella hygida]